MTRNLFKKLYAKEVLGIQSYICPPSIWKLRQIEGSWGALVLVVVLEPLLPSQKPLLKKIMASIAIFKYSVLQIKESSLLVDLLDSSNPLAKWIFLFGLKDSPYPVWPDYCFWTPYSLKELEASSLEVQSKKQALWQELKKFQQANKKAFKFDGI